ncbi:hypothetical protein ACWC0C_07095 [Streptomyces sp. NPDC001709]
MTTEWTTEAARKALAATPAPFLGGPLADRNTPRNAEGAARFFAQCAAYGYIPMQAEEAGTDDCTKTRCSGVHSGYAGSEHRTRLACALCGAEDLAQYPSHIRRGAGHTGCPFRGKAARVAAVERLTGAPVQAPAPAEYRNGHGGTLGQEPEPAPVEDAAEAVETAEQTRSVAVETAAKSRPAPAPKTRPPRVGAAMWRALEGFFTTAASFPNVPAGTWDAERPHWVDGTKGATLRAMEACERAGLVTRTGSLFRITAAGESAYRAGYDASATAPDDGTDLDADDRRAVKRLAESAGLAPKTRTPRRSRSAAARIARARAEVEATERTERIASSPVPALAELLDLGPLF